jgi:hypothetical protein
MFKNSVVYAIKELRKPLQPKEFLNMAHSSTLLSQMPAFIPRHVFQKLEKRHKTGRASRQLGFKEQFTVMSFLHLAARRSLRDGLRGLQSLKNRLYHLGLGNVARSTLADANRARPVEFFKDLFAEMYTLCRPTAPKHSFRFKSKLFSLDSTTISLCLSLFPWASFRSNKGGIKIHTLLDHDGHIPAFATVTEAKTNDCRLAKTLDLPGGSIVVFDKAYIDYQWFQALGEKGVFFVTRLKKNAVYKLLERRPVHLKTGLTSDHTIQVNHRGMDLSLRRIGYRDPETNHRYEFLTNNFLLAAQTTADIYKERWSIELFFKEIKQNLKINSFVGYSENAALIQIYTALTLYLLLAWQKFLGRIGISVQQIFQLIQLHLLGSLSLVELLSSTRRKTKDEPFFKQLPLFA